MAKQEKTDDQRESARLRRLQLVQISRYDAQGVQADVATGRTLNLSHGGMRLELSHPLPLRATIQLSIALGDDIIEVNGSVRYLEVIDDVRNAMGVEFIDLTPADQAAISGFLDKQ